MAARGMDCGTYNLVCAKRGEDGEVKSRKEINAFLEIPLENRFTFNMLKKAKIPLIERENIAYVVGQGALDLAQTLNLSLRRPMKDGCLNASEKDAFRILSIMIHSMIGEVENDKDILYYSVPANAINQETDADYHQKVLDQIFKSYKYKEKTVQAYPMNEALALIFAELEDNNFTGFAMSCGGGQLNLCYAIFSQPVFAFSLVNAGDWIDKQAATATGETPLTINKEKPKVDLLKPPTSLVERAIQTQYRILIEKAVNGIKKALSEEASLKVRTDNPLPFVVAGGTSMVTNFDVVLREVIDIAKLPMPISEIRRPKDPLYAVGRGLLVAAENSI